MAHAHCMLDNVGYKYPQKYVTLIAFPLQQRLHERASMLRYAYIAYLVRYKFLLEAAKKQVPVDGLKDVQALNRDIPEGL
jgi:hypothetical protein